MYNSDQTGYTVNTQYGTFYRLFLLRYSHYCDYCNYSHYCIYCMIHSLFLNVHSPLTKHPVKSCLEGGPGCLVSALGKGEVLESGCAELHRLIVDLLENPVEVGIGIGEVETTHQVGLGGRGGGGWVNEWLEGMKEERRIQKSHPN